MRKYQYYNTNDDNDRDIYGADWGAQTFTPAIDHVIGKVKLKLFRVGDPGTITVSIKSTSGGKPVGADLCSGIILGTDITLDSNGDWYEISFGDGFDLDVNAQYAIVVRAPGGDSDNKVSWRADITDPTFTGGTFASSSDSGVDWGIVSGVDCMFEEWGVGPASPTTVVWGNLFKSQISAEKVEEAILRLIQSHEDDPDAHVESGESLYSHKAQAIIDHIANSIIEDKILAGEITAPKLSTSAKVGEVVVATSDGDYADLQSALDAGKTRIFIKAGTYETATTITITANNVLIRGEDRMSTIIKLANDSDVNVMDVEGNGIDIKGIQIDGNKANQTLLKEGIYITGDNCSVEKCYVKDVKLRGIMSNGDYNIISNNIVSSCSDGISISNAQYNIVATNSIQGSTLGAIKVLKSHNVIVGNICIGGNDYGIHLYGYYVNVHNTVIGNICKDNDIGIFLEKGGGSYSPMYNTISNNICESNTLYGIQLDEANYNIVSNNVVRLSQEEGILLTTSSHNNISNNLVTESCQFTENGSSYDDIQLETNSDYNIVQGNTCRAGAQAVKPRYGINIRTADCNENFIFANDLYDDGFVTGTLNDSGTSTEIAHNRGYGGGGSLQTVREIIALRADHTYGSTTSESYLSKGSFVTFDKSKYPNLVSIKFAAKLYTAVAGGTAYAILKDQTGGSEISGSEISSTETNSWAAACFKISGDIKANIPSGEKVYVFRMKTSDAAKEARLVNCYLIVEYQVSG